MQIKKIQINPNVRRKGEKSPYAPKIYVHIENESILENLMNRRERTYTEYKKQVLPKVLETISQMDPDLFASIKDLKWGWDKNCGCSGCPCSPGFIGKGNIYLTTDIFVTI
jgi:hypothetical protein